MASATPLDSEPAPEISEESAPETPEGHDMIRTGMTRDRETGDIHYQNPIGIMRFLSVDDIGDKPKQLQTKRAPPRE
jgi:hypothetical protein